MGLSLIREYSKCVTDRVAYLNSIRKEKPVVIKSIR